MTHGVRESHPLEDAVDGQDGVAGHGDDELGDGQVDQQVVEGGVELKLNNVSFRNTYDNI